MKKAELIRRQADANRRLGWFLALASVLTIALAILGNSVSPDSQRIVGTLGVTVLAIFVLGSLLWIGKRADVRCPLCGNSIQGGIYTPLALTTGKCGHCGERIVDE